MDEPGVFARRAGRATGAELSPHLALFCRSGGHLRTNIPALAEALSSCAAGYERGIADRGGTCRGLSRLCALFERISARVWSRAIARVSLQKGIGSHD